MGERDACGGSGGGKGCCRVDWGERGGGRAGRGRCRAGQEMMVSADLPYDANRVCVDIRRSWKEGKMRAYARQGISERLDGRRFQHGEAEE